jgi:hypothetical protein
MAIGFETAADIATGAILGNVVEPTSDPRSDNMHRSTCLNCEAHLTGSFCAACGQKAHVHRTLAGFGHDLIHGVFHFDGKIWRTLPMLFWHPGELTRRYVHGERAKFVSPLALFLFIVFLTYAVFNNLVPHNTELNTKASASKTETEYQSDRKDILSAIDRLEKEKKEKVAAKELGYEWMDTEIARNRASLKELDENRRKEIYTADLAARKFAIIQRESQTTIARLEAEFALKEKSGQDTKAISEKIADEKAAAALMEKAQDNLSRTLEPPKNWTFTGGSFAGSKTLNDMAKHAAENPQLLLYKIQSNAYKFSWALIPISLPFLWLLFFWRRQFKLFDHVVFITYSLCFMMALSTLGAIVISLTQEGSAPFVISILALIFVPPLHMYRQLHGAYQTSRFGAMCRALLLSHFALLALTLFASLILTLGITS